MSRTKWHGLEQRKANYRTREWVKSLSDADAKRMNIRKEEFPPLYEEGKYRVYNERNTTPEQKRYIIRKYLSDFIYQNNICKVFEIVLEEGWDFAETITPNGTRGLTIKKIK